MVSIDESHWVIIWVRCFCPRKWNQDIYVYVIVAGSVWMHCATQHLQVKKNRGMVSMMVSDRLWPIFSQSWGPTCGHADAQPQFMLIWLVRLVMSKWAKKMAIFPTFSLLKKWAICATCLKVEHFPADSSMGENDLLIQVSKFYWLMWSSLGPWFTWPNAA